MEGGGREGEERVMEGGRMERRVRERGRKGKNEDLGSMERIKAIRSSISWDIPYLFKDNPGSINSFTGRQACHFAVTKLHFLSRLYGQCSIYEAARIVHTNNLRVEQNIERSKAIEVTKSNSSSYSSTLKDCP